MARSVCLLLLLIAAAPVTWGQAVRRRTFQDGTEAFTLAGKLEVSREGVVRVNEAHVEVEPDLMGHLRRLAGRQVKLQMRGRFARWKATGLLDPVPTTLSAWVPPEPGAAPEIMPPSGALDPQAPLSRLVARQRGRVVEIRAYRYRAPTEPLLPVALRARTAAGPAWVLGWDETRGTVEVTSEGPQLTITLPLARVELGVAGAPTRVKGHVVFDSRRDLFVLDDGRSIALSTSRPGVLPPLRYLAQPHWHLEVEGVMLAPEAGGEHMLVRRPINLVRHEGATALTGTLSQGGSFLTTRAGAFRLSGTDGPRSPDSETWIPVHEVLPGRRVEVTVSGWEVVMGDVERELIVTGVLARSREGEAQWVSHLRIEHLPLGGGVEVEARGPQGRVAPAGSWQVGGIALEALVRPSGPGMVGAFR